MKENKVALILEIVKIADIVITKHPRFSVFLTVITTMICTIFALSYNADNIVIIINAFK